VLLKGMGILLWMEWLNPDSKGSDRVHWSGLGENGGTEESEAAHSQPTNLS